MLADLKINSEELHRLTSRRGTTARTEAGRNEEARIESKNGAKKGEPASKHKAAKRFAHIKNAYSLKSAVPNALPHCFTGNITLSMIERLFYYPAHQGIR